MALLLKNARCIDPSVSLDEVCDIYISEGKIVEVGQNLAVEASEVRDLQGKILVPGLVDVHVHLREPGYELKESIATGTRACAHGGFTGVCSMPNTQPCTDDSLAIEYILSVTAREGKCRVYPSGACTKGLKGEALAEMGDMVKHGAVCFTDDGRGVQDSGMMRRVMDYASMFNRVVMSHCQDEALVGPGQVNEGVCSTRMGLAGWPAEGEELQIARDIAICRLTGCPLHVQHLSTARGLNLVRQAKAEGLPVTCEVTPHHMFLSDEDIKSDYDTNMKVNPPLRTPEDSKALIEGLLDGTIDCIVTDHAPHAPWEKDREFERAPFGMTGIETSLGLVLTNLVDKGIIDYAKMVELMAITPRDILRVPQVQLASGNDADLTIFDPEIEWTVTEDWFMSRAKNSGFIGAQLKGQATDVYVGGCATMVDGQIVD